MFVQRQTLIFVIKMKSNVLTYIYMRHKEFSVQTWLTILLTLVTLSLFQSLFSSSSESHVFLIWCPLFFCISLLLPPVNVFLSYISLNFTQFWSLCKWNSDASHFNIYPCRCMQVYFMHFTTTWIFHSFLLIYFSIPVLRHIILI